MMTPKNLACPALLWLFLFGACSSEERGVGAPAISQEGYQPRASSPEELPQGEWREVAQRLLMGSNEILGQAPAQGYLEVLAQGDLDVVSELRTKWALVLELIEAGDVAQALKQLEEGVNMIQTRPELRGVEIPHNLIALAYLRQAEFENCIQLKNQECCLFPLAGGGKHSLDEPARNALLHYTSAYRENTTLELRWLMNLSSMMLAEHPEGMPEELRFPEQAFRSKQDVGRFVDVAGELGVDSFDLCGGVVVEDFDADGLLDLVVTSSDPLSATQLFRGTPDAGFAQATRGSGLDQQFGGLNCVGGDYDGDGDTDILILRGAWLFDDGQIRNSLMRNDGGRFTDVTLEAGLAGASAPTQAACWGDFDGDGDLDLYVVNESRLETDPPGSSGGNYPAQYYVNDGQGHFVENAKAAGLTNDRYAKGVAAGDFDNDGDLDLYVSNLGRNRLYRNDGKGVFRDVARKLGVMAPKRRSFACWFFDYDNDGWLDLFVTAFDAQVSDVAADYLGQPFSAERPRLYRNLGGRFREVGAGLGLEHAWLPMGANFGDLDNDGWLDIYLATGDPNFQTLVPNIMLRNDRGRGFQDVSFSGGFGHLQKGHGVAFFDFDGDGDQDIYNQLGGFYPGDRFHNALFQNPGHQNHFIKLRLLGTECHPSAIGARLMLELETPSGARQIHRAVGSVSSFGSTPLRQEIGLGDATAIRRVEVRWPGDYSSVQVFGPLPLDSNVELTQGLEAARVLKSVR